MAFPVSVFNWKKTSNDNVAMLVMPYISYTTNCSMV